MDYSIFFIVLVACALSNPIFGFSGTLDSASIHKNIQVNLLEIWCETEDISATCRKAKDLNLCVGTLFKEAYWREMENDRLINYETRLLGSTLLEITCEEMKPTINPTTSTQPLNTPTLPTSTSEDEKDMTSSHSSSSSFNYSEIDEPTDNNDGGNATLTVQEFIISNNSSVMIHSDLPEGNESTAATVPNENGHSDISKAEKKPGNKSLSANNEDLLGSTLLEITSEEMKSTINPTTSTQLLNTHTLPTSTSEDEKDITPSHSSSSSFSDKELDDPTDKTTSGNSTLTVQEFIISNNSSVMIHSDLPDGNESTTVAVPNDNGHSETPKPEKKPVNESLTVNDGELIPYTHAYFLYGSIALSLLIILLGIIVMIIAFVAPRKATNSDIQVISVTRTTNSGSGNDKNTAV